jgi:hypothetical protein
MQPNRRVLALAFALASWAALCAEVRAQSPVAPSPPAPDAAPSSAKSGDAPSPSSNDNSNGNGNGKEEERLEGCFPCRFLQAYINEFRKAGDPILDPKWRHEQNEAFRKEMETYYSDGPEALDPPRRALPSPWQSPPFPGHEYQGYPLIGVPYHYQGTALGPNAPTVYPLMQAVNSANTPLTDAIRDSGITFAGWATGAGTWSTAHNSNTPTSYWIVPNSFQLDQVILKLERYPNTVQTDHIDWGFRSIALYGIDYRYTTAGGWFSDQLLKNNKLYGWDPVEQYFNVYIPGFLGGTDIRIGRWIACPDIETQYSVDNYLGSHSLLFTVDTYTQTGVMLTQKINDQWMVQAVLHSGTDMAPWYKGAIPTGAFGVRWVSHSNNDAFYTWLNAINNAEFRHFIEDGKPAGHDNFNYFVTTWEHRFNSAVHTKTEAYYMWQRNAEVGGTPSLGPVEPWGGGGGDGVLLPGLSRAYGVLNYTMFGLGKRDYVTARNEWYRDERGMRTGFVGSYTSHTLGISHQFNDYLMLRPEIGYYRNWDNPAFDLGTRQGLWLYGFDVTLRW